MDEAGQHSSLIGDIYDAALDPSRWLEVLEKSAQFVDASAVTLIVQDRIDKGANFERHFGLDPYYEQLYEDKYRKSDPRVPLRSSLKVGEVLSASAAISHSQFRDTPLYQEYLQPQGVSDNIICVFERSQTGYSVFGLFRHDGNGPVDTTFRRTRLLMPHMRRAVLISRTVNLGKAEVAAFTDMLDGLRAGIFLLDARLRIVHANRSGHALLAHGVLLRTADGRLTANERDAKRTLDRGVAMAAEGDSAVGGERLTMRLQANGDDGYVAHLLPLTSGERRRAGTMYEAVAALFVYRAALEVLSPPEIIATRYNLTPMELNVLLAIFNAGGVPEVAELLGIARTTVKTHLHRLFAKTDTRRQVDLVKLVAGFSDPLVR